MPVFSSFLSGCLSARRRTALAILSGAAFLPAGASAASLNVYLSAPTVQSTFVTNASTETFNSLSIGNHTTTYNSAIGQYQFSSTAKMAVQNWDNYGGANKSRYVALGVQSGSASPVTLSLNTPANYFGFWWSAGDAKNGLSFYYNNTLLTRLTTAQIISLLGGPTGHVTAVNGVTYNSSQYYGNPNNGGDTGEPFAYVNIVASGTGFNRIVFDNSGATSSGFETDNHSVYLGNVSAPGSSVFVESVPTIQLTVSPEPGTIGVLALGLIGTSFLRFRRKQS